MLDHIAIQLDREGIKGREDGERRGGGYLKYFHQSGGGEDNSREAINRGTAIIRGNTVCKQSKMHVNVKSIIWWEILLKTHYLMKWNFFETGVEMPSTQGCYQWTIRDSQNAS